MKRQGAYRRRGIRIITVSLVLLCILLVCMVGPAAGKRPTPDPTEEPTPDPTEEPTPDPTEEPTPDPTEEPTPDPTEVPPDTPTPDPTEIPTETPTAEPTGTPTAEPTGVPTESPTPDLTTETPSTTSSPGPIENPPDRGDSGYEAVIGSATTPNTNPDLSTSGFSCTLLESTIFSSEAGRTIQWDRTGGGDSVELSGGDILFYNRGLQIRIELDKSPNPADTLIRGTVNRTTLTTDPVIGEIREKGIKFMGKVEAILPSAPPCGSHLAILLDGTPEDSLQNRFRQKAQEAGTTLRDVSYTMTVHTENLTSPLTATVVMSASPDWVATQGRGAIRIMRIAEDGKGEILETTTSGYDPFGNLIFKAESPHGFSTFGLVSLLIPSGSTSPVSPLPTAIQTSTMLPATHAPLLPFSSSNTPVSGFMVPGLFLILAGEGFAFLYLLVQVRKEG